MIITISESLSPLCLTKNKKFIALDNTIIASTGYYPDSRQLLKQSNAIHETHKNTYCAKPTIEYISNQLSQWIVKSLYKGMSNTANDDEESEQVALRPYSTAAIISSYDELDKHIKLYQIENSGVIYPTSLAIFGKVSNNLRQSIKHAIITSSTDKEGHNYDSLLDQKIKRVINLLATDLLIYSDDSHHSHTSVPVGREERKGHNYEFDVLITHKDSVQHYIVIA